MAKGVGLFQREQKAKSFAIRCGAGSGWWDERAVLLLRPYHSSHLSIHSWTQLLSIGPSCLALYLFNLPEDKEGCSTESSFVSLSISSIGERAELKPQAMVCVSCKSSKALSSYAVLCCLFYWVTTALLYTICLFETWWTTLQKAEINKVLQNPKPWRKNVFLQHHLVVPDFSTEDVPPSPWAGKVFLQTWEPHPAFGSFFSSHGGTLRSLAKMIVPSCSWSGPSLSSWKG